MGGAEGKEEDHPGKAIRPIQQHLSRPGKQCSSYEHISTKWMLMVIRVEMKQIPRRLARDIRFQHVKESQS